eukprot:365661-Chlamydomonas_euryale.AAC.28
MPKGEYDEYLAVAVDAAKAAGGVIAEAFRKPKNVEHKGAVDLVTETDQQCETLVHERIRAAFPSHRCLGACACVWTCPLCVCCMGPRNTTACARVFSKRLEDESL